MLPASAKVLREDAWRTPTYALTEAASAFMGDSMTLRIETAVREDERDECDNVFGLDESQLKQVRLLGTFL